MSLVPDFDFGLWNAWIIVVVYLAVSFVPFMLGGKTAEDRMEGEPGFKDWSTAARVTAIVDHGILMPLTLIYSFFVPLERGNWWLYTGLLVCAIAIVIAAAASAAFATAPLEEPMTTGAYAISRHPMYVTGILLYLGVGLAGTSWIFLLCAVIDFAVWRMAVPEEEHHMVAKYGSAYEDYLQRTPRWIGWPKGRRLVGSR
jgi:protein-S-isoprenylcysteine O-methyltransferase Ste14